MKLGLCGQRTDQRFSIIEHETQGHTHAWHKQIVSSVSLLRHLGADKKDSLESPV